MTLEDMFKIRERFAADCKNDVQRLNELLDELAEKAKNDYGAEENDALIAALINSLCADIHQMNRGWWTDLTTGEYPIKRNVGELLALVHGELSEALEGHRKNLRDEHLPLRPSIEVELADAMIRIMDMAAGLELDLGGAFVEKSIYNQKRADHKIENRKKADGKKY